MKRLALGTVLAALGLCLTGAASAQVNPGDGITGTPHDLAFQYPSAPADSLERICIFCHAPHNTYKLSVANGGPGINAGAGPEAPDDYTYLPLWNHDVTLESFSMYYNGPGAPQIGPLAAQSIDLMDGPGPDSLLCLSCHDGSVAVNAYGNSAQLPGSQGSGGNYIDEAVYLIGKDGYLGNHHPIGFNYDVVASLDNQIYDADAAQFAGAGTVRDHLFGPGNTQMECSTCHSVHNKGNSGETLLWSTDRRSALCLSCHDK